MLRGIEIVTFEVMCATALKGEEDLEGFKVCNLTLTSKFLAKAIKNFVKRVPAVILKPDTGTGQFQAHRVACFLR